jgi:hypothetical protein
VLTGLGLVLAQLATDEVVRHLGYPSVLAVGHQPPGEPGWLADTARRGVVLGAVLGLSQLPVFLFQSSRAWRWLLVSLVGGLVLAPVLDWMLWACPLPAAFDGFASDGTFISYTCDAHWLAVGLAGGLVYGMTTGLGLLQLARGRR